MKVEMNKGDVIFKRAQNGWIIQKVVKGEEELMETYVVEDVSNNPSEGLWRLFREVLK